MAKHALLSASGAHRWLECTPSALLELQFPQSTSEYAEEGTAAHELCELTARYFLGEVSEMDFENRRDELAKGPYATLRRRTSRAILVRPIYLSRQSVSPALLPQTWLSRGRSLSMSELTGTRTVSSVETLLLRRSRQRRQRLLRYPAAWAR